MLTAHLNHLHSHKFEAFHLKSLDDLSNEAPLHTIGLDGNEGTLRLGRHDSETKQRLKLKALKNTNVAALQKLTDQSDIWHRQQWGRLLRAPTPLQREARPHTLHRSMLRQQCQHRTCGTTTRFWPHPQGFNQHFHCTAQINLSGNTKDTQASQETLSRAKIVQVKSKQK